MKSPFRAPASPPGTSRATPPVKGERSEGEAFTLDKGLHWESTAGSRFLVVPARSAYHMWRRKLKENPSDPKYIHTELGIGYRMLDD